MVCKGILAGSQSLEELGSRIVAEFSRNKTQNHKELLRRGAAWGPARRGPRACLPARASQSVPPRITGDCQTWVLYLHPGGRGGWEMILESKSAGGIYNAENCQGGEDIQFPVQRVSWMWWD